MTQLRKNNKFKIVTALLLCGLLMANVLVLNSCGLSETQAQGVEEAFAVPNIKTGTITLTSLDKEVKTDAVSYTIKRITQNHGEQTIYDEITTTNGIFTKSLTLGKYEIAGKGMYTYHTVVELKEDGETMELSAQNNRLYVLLSQSEKVCVIGDSITSGSCTKGHGWHEGLLSKFENIKETQLVAKGGQTTASLFTDKIRMEKLDKANADTYIIALGVNDCLKRGGATPTSSNIKEYLVNIEKLVNYIRAKDSSEEANLIFVSPFTFANKNTTAIEKYLQKDNIHQAYINALEKWCAERAYLCISPMNYVNHVLETAENAAEYMYDDLHPAYPKGTELYGEAVYQSCTMETGGTLEITQSFYQRTIKKAGQTPTYTDKPVKKDNTIHGATFFSIRNSDTGKYVKVGGKEDAAKTGVYYFDGEDSDEMLYYSVGEDTAKMVVEDMPQGCYQVIYGGNTEGYGALRLVTVMYVTPGSAPTHAVLMMNADKTET